MTEPTFDLRIGTLVGEQDGKPWVTIQVVAKSQSGAETMVTAMKMTPEEARTQGQVFFEAAEAADASANIVLSLREQKVPEEQVLGVIERMRERRGRY